MQVMSQPVPAGFMPPPAPGFAPSSRPFSYMIPEKGHHVSDESLQKSSVSVLFTFQDVDHGLCK